MSVCGCALNAEMSMNKQDNIVFWSTGIKKETETMAMDSYDQSFTVECNGLLQFLLSDESVDNEERNAPSNFYELFKSIPTDLPSSVVAKTKSVEELKENLRKVYGNISPVVLLEDISSKIMASKTKKNLRLVPRKNYAKMHYGYDRYSDSEERAVVDYNQNVVAANMSNMNDDAELTSFCGRTDKSSHYCTRSSFSYVKKSFVSRHMVYHSHTAIKPLMCKACGLTFGNLSSFDRHRQIHLDGNHCKKKQSWSLFNCRVCTLSFQTNSSLSEHIQNVHPG